jgi:hypothetical protein
MNQLDTSYTFDFSPESASSNFTIDSKSSLSDHSWLIVLPIEEVINQCRKELQAADYRVVQLGHRRLLGCKPGSASFIELNLQKSSAESTQLTCQFRN